ncbi:MAG: hypothetical protein WBL85_08995, partial [Sedimentisphaerales bacterium]
IIGCLLLNTIAIRAGTKNWLPTGSFFFANQSHCPYITKGTVWFERTLSGSCVDFSTNPAKFLFSNIKPISVTEQFFPPADINPSKDNAPATVACCPSLNSNPNVALIRQFLMVTVGLSVLQENNFSIIVRKIDNDAESNPTVKIPFIYKFYEWAFWGLFSLNVIVSIVTSIKDHIETNRILNHHKLKGKE